MRVCDCHVKPPHCAMGNSVALGEIILLNVKRSRYNLGFGSMLMGPKYI